jgi:enterochelin esterase-like enzyme
MTFAIKAVLPVFLSAVATLGSAQDLHLSSGTVTRIENFQSRFVNARTVDVWLPDGYSSEKKYSVLYMHDGQMLFDSANTWNHQEWKVDETASLLMKEHKIRDCIVVGIHNGKKLRHCEYFPQAPFESLKRAQQDSIMMAKRPEGLPVFYDAICSDNYLRFLVTELKPYIDSAFSTKADRDGTFIAGSSMGGLISMYAICEYPDVFGGAACLSTHWTGIFTTTDNPVPAKFMKYLKKKLPDPATHKLYFDYGSKGLDAIYKPYQQQADKILRRKGYSAENRMTQEFPGENHSEKAWAKRLEMPLIFLLGK